MPWERKAPVASPRRDQDGMRWRRMLIPHTLWKGSLSLHRAILLRMTTSIPKAMRVPIDEIDPSARL